MPLLTPESILEDLKKYPVEDLWVHGNLRAVKIGYKTHFKNVKRGGWHLLIVRDEASKASIRTDIAKARALLKEPFGQYFGFPETWGDQSLLPLGPTERLAAFQGHPDLRFDRGIIPEALDLGMVEWLERGGTLPLPLPVLHPRLLKLQRDEKSVVIDRGDLSATEAVERALCLDLLHWKGWVGTSHRILEPRHITMTGVTEILAPSHHSAPTMRSPDATEAPSQRSQEIFRDLLQQLRSSESEYPFPSTEREAIHLISRMRSSVLSGRVDADSGTIRPSAKQISYMQSIASRLGIAIPESAMIDKARAGEFISLNKAAFDRWYARPDDGANDELSALPPPGRLYATIEEVLAAYKVASSATGWINGMPRERGLPIARYRDVVRNAESVLQGNSLRGMPLELDIARKRVLGHKGKAAIHCRAFLNDRTLLVSWSPADHDDQTTWISNSRTVDKTNVLLRFEDFSRIGAYPSAERLAPFNPNANVDAWAMTIVKATLDTVQAKLEAHFQLKSSPSICLRDHPMNETEAPIPWMWALANETEMQEADAAVHSAFAQGRMVTPHGMDAAVVMAEKGARNIVADDWSFDHAPSWKIVRDWMIEHRSLSDPDRAAARQEAHEEQIARDVAKKEKAKAKRAIVKTLRDLADAVLDAIIPTPDIHGRTRDRVFSARSAEDVIPVIMDVIPDASIPLAFDHKMFRQQFIEREPRRRKAAGLAPVLAGAHPAIPPIRMGLRRKGMTRR